jgi:hypothetical protein
MRGRTRREMKTPARGRKRESAPGAAKSRIAFSKSNGRSGLGARHARFQPKMEPRSPSLDEPRRLVLGRPARVSWLALHPPGGHNNVGDPALFSPWKWKDATPACRRQATDQGERGTVAAPRLLTGQPVP